MPESARDINITAEERAHPAIRKLARAMIALARLKLGQHLPTVDAPLAGPERDHA